MIFNENRRIIYPTDGRILLMDEEWAKIQDGQTVTVKQELKRFDQAVTFVLLPYMHNGEFIGGLLLTSPISGSREMISQINRYLWYAVMIALVVALLFSWFLASLHVNRIKRLQEATSLYQQEIIQLGSLLQILMKLVNWQKTLMIWCKS